MTGPFLNIFPDLGSNEIFHYIIHKYILNPSELGLIN